MFFDRSLRLRGQKLQNADSKDRGGAAAVTGLLTIAYPSSLLVLVSHSAGISIWERH